MIGWLVGILEGEGWFMLVKRQYRKDSNLYFRPKVGVVNTNPILIERLHTVLLFLGIPHFIRSKQMHNPKWSDQKVIYIDGLKRVKKLLDVVYNHLTSKKDVATLIKQFIDHRLSIGDYIPYTNIEHDIYNHVIELNNRIRKDNPQRLHAEPNFG